MDLLKKDKNQGFSVIELLLIAVIVCILGLLVLTFYSGVQEKDRDNTRRADIQEIQGKIESYNAQYGNYPTLAQLNSASFRAKYISGLSGYFLKDPKGTSEALVSTPAPDVYAYAASPLDCDDKTIDCTGYTLTATLESGGTFVKESIN